MDIKKACFLTIPDACSCENLISGPFSYFSATSGPKILILDHKFYLIFDQLSNTFQMSQSVSVWYEVDFLCIKIRFLLTRGPRMGQFLWNIVYMLTRPQMDSSTKFEVNRTNSLRGVWTQTHRQTDRQRGFRYYNIDWLAFVTKMPACH